MSRATNSDLVSILIPTFRATWLRECIVYIRLAEFDYIRTYTNVTPNNQAPTPHLKAILTGGFFCCNIFFGARLCAPYIVPEAVA
jgi:hypothetical protein